MRVIVIECDRNLRNDVVSAFSERGHNVTPVDNVAEAKRWIEAGIVDLIIADVASAGAEESLLLRAINAQRHPIPVVITTPTESLDEAEALRSVSADVLHHPWTDEAVDEAIERAQTHHLLHGDALKVMPFLTETIQFVIPSRVEYLDGILNHLSERLVKLGIVEPESIDVVVALDEAIVNAIKHGNSYDPGKTVRIVAEINRHLARFVIEDEGSGFRPQDVPDPCAPENLLRPSGRGLLLIRNIMDEVEYNSRGNVVTMIKRAGSQGTGSLDGAANRHGSDTSDSPSLS